MIAALERKSPNDHDRAGHLDHRIEAEPDQCYGAGQHTADDRDNRLQGVPGNRGCGQRPRPARCQGSQPETSAALGPSDASSEACVASPKPRRHPGCPFAIAQRIKESASSRIRKGIEEACPYSYRRRLNHLRHLENDICSLTPTRSATCVMMWRSGRLPGYKPFDNSELRTLAVLDCEPLGLCY